MEKQNYIAPQVEVLEVKVEQGFAATEGRGGFIIPNGGNNEEHWW